MKFTVVLHTDDGTRYGVCAPDLPGCFSGGNDIDDALTSVQEAIDLHVETLLEDGHDIPVRKPISTHQANPDYAGGVWAVVDVRVEKYFGPAQKINITVPSLLDQPHRRLRKGTRGHTQRLSAQAARAAMARA